MKISSRDIKLFGGTISLLNRYPYFSLDSTLIMELFSDVNASYNIEDILFGEYFLKVYNHGYKDTPMKVEVSGKVGENRETLNVQ